jgi:hypothetical protein
MSVAQSNGPSVLQGPQIPELSVAGLTLLLEANRCARRLGCDLWEFAVEIEVLRAAGLTNSQLRCLLQCGYAQHRLEKGRTRAGRRCFRRLGNLRLPAGTCVLLTEKGVTYAGEIQAERETRDAGEEAPDRPTWDRCRRELRLGLILVKQFRQPAANQELVLDAFEEEAWPPRIDDPLPPVAEQDAKKRLQRTINNLNRSQENAVIRFTGGGDGQSVGWARRPRQM